MNINETIWNESKKYPNLAGYQTGGGCDYITRVLSNKRELVLSDAFSECPTTLDVPAIVYVYRSTDDQLWADLLAEFNFDTVTEAMEFMQDEAKVEQRIKDVCKYCGFECHTDGGEGCDEWQAGGFENIVYVAQAFHE